MRSTIGAVPVALAAAIPCRPDSTLGWWDTGHQIIAQVATDRLNPHATAAVKDILKNDSTGLTLIAVAGWVKVTFFGATNEAPPFQHSPWNLHAVWDGGLIDHTKRSQATYVKRLEGWIATQNVSQMESGTVTDWANETHGQALNHAYRTANGTKDFPATGGTIGKTYYKANSDVVDQQLAKAGVRLAKVLNDAFPRPARDSRSTSGSASGAQRP